MKQLTIVMFTAVGLFFLPTVETFAVLPSTSVTSRRISKNSFAKGTKFGATVVSGTPAITQEKLTKEAKELVDILEQKEKDTTSHLVVSQVAPSVRVAISEEFGLDPGKFTPETLVAALKELGFDLVLDTNTGADLTIVEEATELLSRLKAEHGKERGPFAKGDPGPEPLPMFTSCCPGWLHRVEEAAPEIAPYVSTCKSPHMMYGAMIKAYCEDLFGLPPEKVYFTSVMPCVKKRGESDQPAFFHETYRDVDNVITTRDLGSLLRMKGIDPQKLKPMPFDSPFQTGDGKGTGAGQLFGVTGGVMEAAVRTLYEFVTGSKLERLELDDVRGLEGTKESTVPLHSGECMDNGVPTKLRVAVVHGLGNAKKLIQKMKDGEVEYDFIEVMACPGGCIGGGGQPKAEKETRADKGEEIPSRKSGVEPAYEKGSLEKRLECIYDIDRSLPRRRSHENPTVKAFYEKYLGEFGGEKAHELLHVEPVYGKKPAKKTSSKEDL